MKEHIFKEQCKRAGPNKWLIVNIHVTSLQDLKRSDGFVWEVMNILSFPKLQTVSVYFIKVEGEKERSWRDMEGKIECEPKGQCEPLFTIQHLAFISTSYMNFNIAKY